MNRIISIAAAAMLLLTASCEDFLDEKNLFDKSLDNYYKTPKDIQEALAGAYEPLYVEDAVNDEFVASGLMSDIQLPGGGPDDMAAKNVANFQDPGENTYKELWENTFKGVSRCNAIIFAAKDADFSAYFDSRAEAEAFKNKALGEAYFMRGFYYFRAARFFGQMPIITSPNGPFDVPRASIDETYGQIASDFKKAAELLPNVPANTIPTSENGHTNRWVAKAYLARTYLHYTGYSTNILKKAVDVITLPEGGTVTKDQVIAELEDVRDHSTYALVSDFRNLWPYSYINQQAGSVVLPWANAQGRSWVGQDGFAPTVGTGNTEVMFALMSSYGAWENSSKYSNTSCLFFGIRGNSMIPYGEGWGWGTVHPKFYEDWPNADPRKRGSVIEMGRADEGTDGYQANQGDHETGLFNKKYTSLQYNGAEGVKGMFWYIYRPGGDVDYMLWHMQNYIYLRFADVLLMHSELTETADGINAVRNRAGLTPVAYSLDNLKKERTWEFAFEGIRWFDLVRWGDVETSNNYYQVPANVVNSGVPGTYTTSYRPETKGLVSLPENEITLSNGKYTQNSGW